MYKKYRKCKKIVNVSKLYYFISQSPDHESPETECKFLLHAFFRGVKSPVFIGFSNAIYDPEKVKKQWPRQYLPHI